MKRKIVRVAPDNLSISLPKEMATWLRRSAAKQMTSLSAVIKQQLMPAFDRRHAK